MDPCTGKYCEQQEEGVNEICSSKSLRASLEKPVWCVNIYSFRRYCPFLWGCTVHAGPFSQLSSCLRDDFGVAEGTEQDHAMFLT